VAGWSGAIEPESGASPAVGAGLQVMQALMEESVTVRAMSA
jgi:hypothetical protein